MLKRGKGILYCAWILWQMVNHIDKHMPMGGYENREECLQKSEQANSRLEPDAAKRTTIVFICLPDTVDPRAPRTR
jgi:hypothetical protein